jgi:hypothetical protein
MYCLSKSRLCSNVLAFFSNILYYLCRRPVGFNVLPCINELTCWFCMHYCHILPVRKKMQIHQRKKNSQPKLI